MESFEKCNACGERGIKTDENFIAELESIYGNKFDYSKTSYVRNHELATVICNKHGEMNIKAKDLINGHGCFFCSILSIKKEKRKSSIDWFIDSSREIYGHRFSYRKFEYSGYDKSSILTCLKHGDFQVSPYNHLVMNIGCFKCKKESNSLCNYVFMKKALLINGEAYGYKFKNCISQDSNLVVICSKHGEVIKSSEDVLSGKCCDKCEKDKKRITKRIFNKIINIFSKVGLK